MATLSPLPAPGPLLAAALLLPRLLVAVPAPVEVASFGRALATGLCARGGAPPIVSFPKWGVALTPDQPRLSLAVVAAGGELRPFQGLRSLEEAEAEAPGSGEAALDLISVQALYCPPTGNDLWVLDSGHGVADEMAAAGAAKLLRVALRADGLGGATQRAYSFSEDVVTRRSYLNDVRVDGHGFAYITDSAMGRIVVLELSTGRHEAWEDERMKAYLKPGEAFVIGGQNLSAMQVPVDGIAYSAADDMLYWKPVTRSSLYRIPASVLRQLFGGGLAGAADSVEDLGPFGFHDGLDADLQGNVYLTDLASGAIQRRRADGRVAWVTELGAMAWPDCVIVSGSSLFVLTTQVHLMPFMNAGTDRREAPNQLLRFELPIEEPVEDGRLAAALAENSSFPRAMPAAPELSLREQLAAATRIMALSGLALDVAGHVTAKRSTPSGMLSTPYGVPWRDVTPDDIIELDSEGQVVSGLWDVTPAVAIHTELHRLRPDAGVVIHGHPYYGSLLSAMHEIPAIAEQQAIMFDGDIALYHEYTGGVDTETEGRRLAQAVGNATAIILANHGVMIVGETVAQAAYRAVTFERTCRLHFDILAAGRRPVEVPLPARRLLKRSLNTLSVDNFWRGEVRNLMRLEPDLFPQHCVPRGAVCLPPSLTKHTG